MKTMFKKVMRPAFTLIELVITIVVIGILAAALVATYADLSGSAKTGARKASISALQTQIAILLAKNNGVLPTGDELQQAIANPNMSYSPALGFTVTDGATPPNTMFSIETFTDGGCTARTNSPLDRVACVK